MEEKTTRTAAEASEAFREAVLELRDELIRATGIEKLVDWLAKMMDDLSAN
jgi:hypothetical protein